MDVQAKLDEIVVAVEGARAMPMSASCILNRGELLEQLDELRAMIPAEVTAARSLLEDRSSVLDEGRLEAARIIEEAREESARLVSKTAVAREAKAEADRVLDEAHAQAERLRADVDDYIDTKLANFEVVLHKTLRAVERGRTKLRGVDDVSLEAEDVEPLPG